ncbi:sensor domain-containing diguanylate cyclase [Teredinibacter haidensis]|uniref:sensor domain-containing diguanylate cyclase n=1 Tax=Teredinibacter haidensis TaxID=2731755 RepID=UPI000948C608|nr:sensor domain-containing diguanylate cyclase [Teredinibacter haidensis]
MAITKSRVFKNLVVASVLFLLLVVGVYTVVSREIVHQQDMISQEVEFRTNELRKYFLIAKHLLFSLRNSMQENLELAETGNLQFPAVDSLQEYPELGAYGIESRLISKSSYDNTYAWPTMVGSLTGGGLLEDIDSEHKSELHAALSLNAMLGSVIDAMPDVKWVYYSSAKRFFYLAPAYSFEDFYFKDEHLLKAFWVEAIPKNNPKHELIATEVYEDPAGMGLVISASLPVLYNNKFRGLVSLDIGMDSLVHVLNRKDVRGYSALIDENQTVIIKDTNMRSSKMALSPGELLFLKPVLDRQIMLLHKVPRRQIVISAITDSMTRLVVIFFAIVLIYMIYHQSQLMRRIERLADTDPLTKLMNRRAMTRIVQSMIEFSRRYRQPIGFLLMDIDHFKRVNDTYGHAVGDKVLTEIAGVVSKTVRVSDQTSRHGGEEFLIALPNADINESEQLAERVRMAVQKHKLTQDDLHLTISIGCAELHESEEYSDVLKRADDALYQAKNSGRNRVVVSKS